MEGSRRKFYYAGDRNNRKVKIDTSKNNEND